MNMSYIQNRTNWCWAVACKIVGERYKKNNPHFIFNVCEKVILTDYQDGLRKDIVVRYGDKFVIDLLQNDIVKYANNIQPYEEGNFSGDDEAKEKGLKYVISGNCNNEQVVVETIGTFDSERSLWECYKEQMMSVFRRNDYLIGNAILFPGGICHSFVIMKKTEKNEILIYDPWDGKQIFCSIEETFYDGFMSALGKGVIKWIQYIK